MQEEEKAYHDKQYYLNWIKSGSSYVVEVSLSSTRRVTQGKFENNKPKLTGERLAFISLC